MGGTTYNTSMQSLNNPVDLPVELFQMVVGYLPIIDLAKARRVSKGWRTTIDSCIKFHQEMFLEPGQFAVERPIHIWTGGMGYGGLTPYRPIGHFAPPTEEDLAKDAEETGNTAHPVVGVHPLLQVSRYRRWRDRVGVHMTFTKTLRQLLEFPDGGELGQEFITQPPCTQVTLLLVDTNATPPYNPNHPPPTQFGQRQQLTAQTGITLGHVVNALRGIVYYTRKARGVHTKTRTKLSVDSHQEVVIELEGFVAATSHWVEEAEYEEEYLKDIASTLGEEEIDGNEDRQSNSMYSGRRYDDFGVELLPSEVAKHKVFGKSQK